MAETVSPMSWFKDCTYLGHDAQWKNWIERTCMAHGYIAFIDYAPDLGWVFHTLLLPDTTKSRKQIAERFEDQRPNRRDEKSLEEHIARYLERQGYLVRQQVACRAGIADIVTDDAIIEVEFYLSRPKLFEAVGQVLLYRQAINPLLRAVIMAEAIDRNTPVDVARELGVEVVIWQAS